MSELNDIISKPAKTAISNSSISKSYGRVTWINEKENICDITYVNSSGKPIHKNNVEILMRTKKDNWFPKIGELVTTEETNDERPIVTGQLIRDYVRDVKPNRIYNKDIQPGKKYQTRNKIT